MSIETNKSLVSRYFEEVCNAGRLDVADELFSDGFGSPGGIRGPEAARRAAQAMRNAFPDIHFRIDELVGEDDRVVAKITYTGTHRGRFLGVEPTGRTISFTGVELAICAAGRIVAEGWHVIDHAEIHRQLQGTTETDPAR